MPKKIHPSLEKLFKSLPTVAVFHREDGVFWVEFPDIPGCYAQGDTYDKALEKGKFSLFSFFEVPKQYSNPKFIETKPSNFPAQFLDPSVPVRRAPSQVRVRLGSLVDSFV